MTALSQFSPLMLLVLSLIALIVGPFLFVLARSSEKFLEGLDGFVLVAICGLVLLHILPHTVEDIGWPAIVVILASLLIPTYIERVKGRFAHSTHTLTMILALLGITLHAFTDGMALINPTPVPNGSTSMLPLAIILHRISDGLTIWWLLRPLYGKWAATRTLILMAVATVLGFFTGQIVFTHLSHVGFGIFEAIMGGSLLHVIFHHEHPMQKQERSTGWQWAAGVGAMLAGLSVIYLTLNTAFDIESSYLPDTIRILKVLALESAPALLIAYFFSGMVQTYLPKAGAAWLKKGSTFTQAAKGLAFGLPLPICSCGVIPVYRSLILQGAPVAAAIAFFVATPELSIDAFVLSIPLLGLRFTLLRLTFAVIVALVMGIVISKISDRFPKSVTAPEDEIAQTDSNTHGLVRFVNAVRQGYCDAVDDTGPWIVFGLLLAALLEPFLKASVFFSTLPGFIEVPFFALLGMPLYVCASGATPLVAVLVHSGVSPGAGLAFLLTGPATNATTLGVLSKYNGKRIAVSFAIGMAVLASIMGMVFNRIFDPSSLPGFFAPQSEMLTHLQILSFGVLAIILCASLLRRGPRQLLNEIIVFEGKANGQDNNHDHAHDHHGIGLWRAVEEKKHEHDDCCH